PAARPPRGDGGPASPPPARPAKGEAPEQAPRREDRGGPSTVEITAEEREPTYTDVVAPRGPGAPVVAGGLLALMALGAFIAWRLGLGTPIEPPPSPAQRPVSRPAAVAPAAAAPKPQGETRPASGAAAPVARPASSAGGTTGTSVVPAQVPTTEPEPGTGATQGPGQDRKAGRVGFLTVDASPWANVYVDGKKLGQTPISREPLEEGLVPVLLMNPETGKSVSRKVRVTAGKTVYLKEDLR
ncbi:MAG TPA: PEGA domain-containing protein, partial [Longimicrobium sp.]|nr:PEGA domain-containing protein [Longimicrobium sp.]